MTIVTWVLYIASVILSHRIVRKWWREETIKEECFYNVSDALLVIVTSLFSPFVLFIYIISYFSDILDDIQPPKWL